MTIKEIDEALEEGNSLKQIAQAYSEIANLKIKRIRSDVERNRIFYEEISYVFGLTKKMAIKKKVNILKPKKTVAIVLTSNYRFYGSINSDLLEFFTNSMQKLDCDKIYLGKAAIDYFRAKEVFQNYKEVLLKDDQPNPAELIELVNILKDYNQVLVFYSSLKSLLVQTPTVADITASPKTNPAGSDADLGSRENFRFIFEPQLQKMLQFFDNQIITLLLEGTFLESELSRTASRFISMDQAETEANKFIKEYTSYKAYVQRAEDNNTILENYASMAAVKRGII